VQPVQVGRLGQVHQLGDAELLARPVDVGLPAQVGTDVLHLHRHLAHLAPQLVVDELACRVAEHVALARGVGGLGDGLEGGLEVLADFG
jgi:hypothetical protein